MRSFILLTRLSKLMNRYESLTRLHWVFGWFFFLRDVQGSNARIAHTLNCLLVGWFFSCFCFLFFGVGGFGVLLSGSLIVL